LKDDECERIINPVDGRLVCPNESVAVEAIRLRMTFEVVDGRL